MYIFHFRIKSIWLYPKSDQNVIEKYYPSKSLKDLLFMNFVTLMYTFNPFCHISDIAFVSILVYVICTEMMI